MRTATLAILGLSLLAGGCVTAGEQRMLDQDRCRSYGFRLGTDAFAKCLLDVDLDRSATLRQRFDSFGAPPFYYRGRW